jgi:hypothetical protein
MSPTQIVALVVALLVIAAVVVAALVVMRRRALRERFGPEYDRVVADAESRSAAEAELRQRERRHAELQLTELDPQTRARYAQEWAAVQARFVEEPAATVAEADELMTRLVRDRGYPIEDYDEALVHLSVEHGHTLGHYRDAHEIYLTNERGEATTEQLRQALMHYRSIFADILGEQPVPDTGTTATTTDVTPDASTVPAETASTTPAVDAAATTAPAAPDADADEPAVARTRQR